MTEQKHYEQVRQQLAEARAELAQWRAAAQVPLLPTLEGERDDARQQLATAEARIAAVRAALVELEAENGYGGYGDGLWRATSRVRAALDGPPPPACSRCRDQKIVPDWSNWDQYHGEPKPKPCPDCAALDGPAEQPATAVALPRPEHMLNLVDVHSDADRAAWRQAEAERWAPVATILADLAKPPTWDASAERARSAAGRAMFHATPPVEEVAGHPDMLAAWLAGMRDRRAVDGVTPEWLGLIEHEGFPVVADDTLPPGEIHLRPHPHPADGPS